MLNIDFDYSGNGNCSHGVSLSSGCECCYSVCDHPSLHVRCPQEDVEVFEELTDDQLLEIERSTLAESRAAVRLLKLQEEEGLDERRAGWLGEPF